MANMSLGPPKPLPQQHQPFPPQPLLNNNPPQNMMNMPPPTTLSNVNNNQFPPPMHTNGLQNGASMPPPTMMANKPPMSQFPQQQSNVPPQSFGTPQQQPAQQLPPQNIQQQLPQTNNQQGQRPPIPGVESIQNGQMHGSSDMTSVPPQMPPLTKTPQPVPSPQSQQMQPPAMSNQFPPAQFSSPMSSGMPPVQPVQNQFPGMPPMPPMPNQQQNFMQTPQQRSMPPQQPGMPPMPGQFSQQQPQFTQPPLPGQQLPQQQQQQQFPGMPPQQMQQQFQQPPAANRNFNQPPAMGGYQQPGYPTSPMQAAAPQKRLDPDQMPNPIQVMAENQRSNGGVFSTLQIGQVPPLVTTQFITQDQGNSGPRYIRSTMYNIPANTDMMKQSAIPFALIISPFAKAVEQEMAPPIVDFGEIGPIRCNRCKAYMSPYMQFVDAGRRFQCLLCKATTEG